MQKISIMTTSTLAIALMMALARESVGSVASCGPEPSVGTEPPAKLTRSLRVTFAAVIYRHGARTPVEPYPTDPYRNESLWPERFGQLTNDGKVEHYEFGSYLRKRYKDLLSRKYIPNEIYIKSTNVDRTIMSAEINTAGLYPPEGSEIWNKDVKWQPVPIHTVADDDEVLAMKKRCPAYDLEMRKYLRSNDYKAMLKTYQYLLEYVEKWTQANVTDFTRLEYIFSTLNIEQQTKFVLPQWTQSVFPEPMREPACFSFKVRTATPLLARLKAGPLLQEISAAMVRSLVRNNTPRVLIYSGHDNTVADVMSALQVFWVHCPPFTAALFIELVVEENQTSANQMMVRLSYRNSVNNTEPKVLNVPGCGRDDGLCPLYTFLQLYKDVIEIDFDKDCGLNEEREDRMRAVFLDSLFKFTMLFVIISAICVLLNEYQKRNASRHDY